MKPKVKNMRGIPFPTHIMYSMISLIVQIMVFSLALYGLDEHYFWVSLISRLLALVTVFYIINKSGKSGARAVPGERAGAVLLSCALARGGFCAGNAIWGGLGHEGRF